MKRSGRLRRTQRSAPVTLVFLFEPGSEDPTRSGRSHDRDGCATGIARPAPNGIAGSGKTWDCAGVNKFEIPCHPNLESYLSAYVADAGIPGDRECPLFRSLERDGSLSERRFNRPSA